MTTFISNIIVIINSFSTLVVAIIAILTLREVYKQRLSTYKPELIFKKQSFKIIKHSNCKIPIIWNSKIVQDDIVNDPDINLNSGIIKYELSILNIGFGSAKNITIELSYDHNSIVSKIIELDKNQEVGLEIGNDFISFKPKQKNYLHYSGITMSLPNQHKKKIDYIQPIHVDKTSLPVEIPLDYLYLCSTLVY